MAKLFGTDGVRGKANTYPITPEVALQMGKAIAHVFESTGHGSRRAVIGKDTRLSGYMLETALTSGMVSMGMDVYLVGPMPTPAVAHLTKSMGASAGVMITASHNPADDNGIKIFNHDGFKLSDKLSDSIESLVLGDEITSRHITYDQIGKAYRIEDARGRYIEYAKHTIGSANFRGLKIVLDCGNGAAYFLGPLIFRELGAEVFEYGCSPNGNNINDKCGALYPEQLSERVREHGAHLGIALDGDADRAIFCDESGRVIDGNKTLGLLAVDLKRRGKLMHDTMAVTVMSNLGLHQAMEREGIKVVTTPVGDRHVIEALKEGGYTFGGEDSGHLVLLEHATTGDGIIAALQIMRMLQESGKSLGELTDFVTICPNKLVNLKIGHKRPLSELPAVQAVLRECEQALGNRGRHLVRYSGTEPKVRVLVEAMSEEDVDHWTERISDVLMTELA